MQLWSVALGKIYGHPFIYMQINILPFANTH